MSLDLLKRQATSQVFERSGQSSQPNWQRTLGCYDPKADQIYQLGNPSIAEQNFGRVPIRIETN